MAALGSLAEGDVCSSKAEMMFFRCNGRVETRKGTRVE